MMAFPFRFPKRCTVAIDLGTAFLRIAPERFGVVTLPMANLVEPPMRGGVIADPLTVAEMLRTSLSKFWRLGILGPRVLVGAPTDVCGEEREALVRTLSASGADDIEIIPEPQASAIGAGLDVSSSYAQMIVDVGEGVTDCAIIREGRIVISHASRVGCGTLRERVRQGVLQTSGFCLTHKEAEKIVVSAGVGSSPQMTGIPIRTASSKTLIIRPEEVQELLEPIIEEIVSVATTLLQKTPHALGCEIIESGIMLTGGGALLPGLHKRLAGATDIHVTIPNDPLGTVVTGLQTMGTRTTGETFQ
jgi:rod shape-determining protein MreB and related proteins